MIQPALSCLFIRARTVLPSPPPVPLRTLMGLALLRPQIGISRAYQTRPHALHLSSRYVTPPSPHRHPIPSSQSPIPSPVPASGLVLACTYWIVHLARSVSYSSSASLLSLAPGPRPAGTSKPTVLLPSLTAAAPPYEQRDAVHEGVPQAQAQQYEDYNTRSVLKYRCTASLFSAAPLLTLARAAHCGGSCFVDAEVPSLTRSTRCAGVPPGLCALALRVSCSMLRVLDFFMWSPLTSAIAQE
ncbi:hypothetical protein MVEN_00490800 [Mycena venus]|uniref:Uncharacterized protein n=1 Tax=Mycena venus TaxID=2733690 RepID=A0A8H6YWS6_9AGAR|nr:hypothetical protein MVEN_00490800 [Mycena venus]